jgi:hypothetical protein
MTVLGTPVSFGAYIFPDTAVEFSDNFREGELASTTLPGIDGVWSEDGDQPARIVEGEVQLRFYLKPATPVDMDDMRDAVARLQSYGLARLIYQPTRNGDARRYTWARISNLEMPRSAEDYSDHYQEVILTFQVPRPVWLVNRYGGWQIGDEHEIGEPGLEIGDGALEFDISGLTNDLTVTNIGNAYALCTVVVAPQAGDSCQNPRVQRVDGGFVLDEFRYQGTLAAGDELTVNGEAQVALLGAASVFGPNFTYLHPAFIRLAPGDNTIRVTFQNAGDDARVTFYYHDTYR